MKNHCANAMIETLEQLWNNFKLAEVSLETCILGNKKLKDILNIFTTEKIEWKLVLLIKYYNNQPELSIQIFKFCFKLCLTRVNSKFLWQNRTGSSYKQA